MGIRGTSVLMLVAVLACAGAADKPADAPRADTKQAETKKKDSNRETAKKDAAPVCMHCGATCGLVPVCVCERGTKKRPRVEFDATCEPICIPGCGSHARRGCIGCTTCGADPCACRGRVRLCRKIRKETIEEEVPRTVHTVQYVCDGCAGRCGTGCCGAGRRQEPPAWWANLTWWWPRKPPR